MHKNSKEDIELSLKIENNIAALAACETGFDLFKQLKALKEQFGYEYFSLVKNPIQNDIPFKDRVLLTNWAAELIEFLTHFEPLPNTNFAQTLWSAVTPKTVDFRIQPEDTFEKQIFSQYLSHGHNTMILIPLNSDKDFNGYVSFSGVREYLNFAEQMELAYICHYIHLNIQKFFLEPNVSIVSLDSRPLEILELLSHGSSLQEIATKLEISPTTVNFHLQKAMAVLGCKTRNHLMAKAFRLSLIK